MFICFKNALGMTVVQNQSHSIKHYNNAQYQVTFWPWSQTDLTYLYPFYIQYHLFKHISTTNNPVVFLDVFYVIGWPGPARGIWCSWWEGHWRARAKGKVISFTLVPPQRACKWTFLIFTMHKTLLTSYYYTGRSRCCRVSRFAWTSWRRWSSRAKGEF